MSPGPKTLFIVGIVLVIVALIWQFGGKFLPLGRLPGDIAVEKENFRFYFPLGTSLLLSLALSAILWLINRWK